MMHIEIKYRSLKQFISQGGRSPSHHTNINDSSSAIALKYIVCILEQSLHAYTKFIVNATNQQQCLRQTFIDEIDVYFCRVVS